MEERLVKLHFEACRSSDGRYWVGECLEIGVCAQAPTLRELGDNLVEALTMYVEDVDNLREEGREVQPIGHARFYWLKMLRWYVVRALAKLIFAFAHMTFAPLDHYWSRRMYA